MTDLEPGPPLVLVLRSLPTERVVGDYTIKGVANRMPPRALFLHPLAADSYLADLADHIGVSDMLRSAESSLHAVQTGRGAQPPGFSGHNFGFSIDVKVDEAIKKTGTHNKAGLDAWFQDRGWYCHRRDHQRGHEDWHMNAFLLFGKLGAELAIGGSYTSDELEQLIQRVYGDKLRPGDVGCQVALKKLRMYSGEIDGDIGPISREAIKAFQRAWGINVDGKLDVKTRRTLAFVAAERQVV